MGSVLEGWACCVEEGEGILNYTPKTKILFGEHEFSDVNEY